MKTIILLLFLAVPANAAIPDEITDPILRDVLEYIDGKASTALTNISALGATIGSTVTILGVANGGTASATAAGARSNLGVPGTDGTGASGTWGINISGNSLTATTASIANSLTGYITVSSACATGTTCTVSCTTGKIMGGDCITNPLTTPMKSYRNSDTTWKCDTNLNTAITVTARCANLQI